MLQLDCGAVLLEPMATIASRRPTAINAFPSVRRRAVLEALEEYAPALLPMAETFLRRTSSFVFLGAGGQGSVLQATLGVEQGDVLAPLLFAVAFRRPVERLREILVATLVADHGYSLEDAESEVVLGAYLDDVLVGLPAPLAAQVPAIAAQAFAPAGCEVEQHKTKVWVPAGLCPAGVSARWWSPAVSTETISSATTPYASASVGAPWRSTIENPSARTPSSLSTSCALCFPQPALFPRTRASHQVFEQQPGKHIRQIPPLR